MSGKDSTYHKADIRLLHYEKTGKGSSAMLTFHGYGQSGQLFHQFSRLAEDYRLYHFDLPFHGKSHWQEGKMIEKEDVKRLFQLFLEKEKIEQFALMAFSLGGKFLLTLLEFFSEKVTKVILIAPNGIIKNPWYRLATANKLFHSLFRLTINYPRPLIKVSDLLQRINLLDKSTLKFITSQMDTRKKREHVFNVWTCYQKLEFDQTVISQVLNKHNISTLLYLGTYDTVIPAAQFIRFIHITEHIHHVNIQVGHQLLVAEVAKRIRKDLTAIH